MEQLYIVIFIGDCVTVSQIMSQDIIEQFWIECRSSQVISLVILWFENGLIGR